MTSAELEKDSVGLKDRSEESEPDKVRGALPAAKDRSRETEGGANKVGLNGPAGDDGA